MRCAGQFDYGCGAEDEDEGGLRGRGGLDRLDDLDEVERVVLLRDLEGASQWSAPMKAKGGGGDRTGARRSRLTYCFSPGLIESLQPSQTVAARIGWPTPAVGEKTYLRRWTAGGAVTRSMSSL